MINVREFFLMNARHDTTGFHGPRNGPSLFHNLSFCESGEADVRWQTR
jgi:hypothetical protein